MSNAATVIIREPWEVKQKLAKIGLTPEIVREIGFEADSAKSDALEIDPYGTAGTWAYQFGIRTTRLRLIPLGWRVSRPGGIEATVNDKLAIQLCFQNVDKACGTHSPKSISGKGSSARELVKSGQSDLFDVRDKSQRASYGKSPVVWLICVSSSEDSFEVEVSCPSVFEGNQFEGFEERIFVVHDGNTPQPEQPSESLDDEFDFDIQVTKK